MANRYLPDSRYPAKSIQSVALVKVHGGSVHHLLAAYSFTQISYRLDRAHTHAAVEPSLKAVATGCQKIARPPVEADAVDKIRGSMGRFQVVLATGVIGIADAAVAIAVIDAVLTPDLTLAYVNALFGGEEALVLRIHKACDQTLRTISVAHHFGDQLKCVVDRFAVVLAGVKHGREIAAGNEGDLVAILFVIRNEEAPRIFVLLPGVVQSQPTDRPGHSAVWTAARKCFPSRADMVRAIVRGLVFADRAVGSHLDLVDAHDRDMGYESALQSRCVRAVGQCTFFRRLKRERGSGTCRPAQKLSSGPGIVHCLPSIFRSLRRSALQGLLLRQENSTEGYAMLSGSRWTEGESSRARRYCCAGLPPIASS